MPANNNIKTPPELIQFLESILFDTKLYTNDEKMNEGIISEMYIRLVDYINSRIVQYLSSAQLDELNEVVVTGVKQDVIDAFIMRALPNYEAVYNTILLEFRDLYLGKITFADLPDAIPTRN